MTRNVSMGLGYTNLGMDDNPLKNAVLLFS